MVLEGQGLAHTELLVREEYEFVVKVIPYIHYSSNAF